ncbi:MAG: hypothetical protein H7A45_20525 [Verrucomicrobiales bacterium]|nr:hypothetical protein [Verrucomicrobiales bacterium]
MDLTFHCPHCRQELVVDAAGAGSSISCPTCEAEITIPEPDVTNIHTANPISTSAAAREERHFSVPVRDAPSEVLVARKVREDEGEGDGKSLRMKVIRHSDCIEVGVDNYEKEVTKFLNKVGEPNIISITPLSYTHLDLGTQKMLTDYAIQIIYRR